MLTSTRAELVAAIGVLSLVSAAVPTAAAQNVSLASVSTSGAQGNEFSTESHLSADGRIVAFTSWATNLVAGDTNDTGDVFLRDLATGQTTRVSVSTAGAQANNMCKAVAISGNGRVVAFGSTASNLVTPDV